MKTYTGVITKLEPNQVFTFGSNTQGRHGAGAALYAKNKFGAKYGQPRGMQGQCYAIVTKDLTKHQHPSVSTYDIVDQIKSLYDMARQRPELEFMIAYHGTNSNLNGYTPQQMAQMFACQVPPDNIVFEQSFRKLVNNYLVWHR